MPAYQTYTKELLDIDPLTTLGFTASFGSAGEVLLGLSLSLAVNSGSPTIFFVLYAADPVTGATNTTSCVTSDGTGVTTSSASSIGIPGGGGATYVISGASTFRHRRPGWADNSDGPWTMTDGIILPSECSFLYSVGGTTPSYDAMVVAHLAKYF